MNDNTSIHLETREAEPYYEVNNYGETLGYITIDDTGYIEGYKKQITTMEKPYYRFEGLCYEGTEMREAIEAIENQHPPLPTFAERLDEWAAKRRAEAQQ